MDPAVTTSTDLSPSFRLPSSPPRYDILTPKRISLIFEKAKVSDLKISSILESLIAPALLPRGFPNMLLLQFLREAAVEVRRSGASPKEVTPSSSRVVGFPHNDKSADIVRAYRSQILRLAPLPRSFSSLSGPTHDPQRPHEQPREGGAVPADLPG